MSNSAWRSRIARSGSTQQPLLKGGIEATQDLKQVPCHHLSLLQCRASSLSGSGRQLKICDTFASDLKKVVHELSQLC